jgi:hypothetical protein
MAKDKKNSDDGAFWGKVDNLCASHGIEAFFISVARPNHEKKTLEVATSVRVSQELSGNTKATHRVLESMIGDTHGTVDGFMSDLLKAKGKL